VEYVLKCFIKHEGSCEVGEGTVASMPIQILQPPVVLEAPIPAQMPVDWAPQMMPAVNLMSQGGEQQMTPYQAEFMQQDKLFWASQGQQYGQPVMV